jgi:dTMP kinase
MDPSIQPHPYPGKLFSVEGIDGSGKSTQLALLHKWLVSEGYSVFFTEWNSSPLVKKTIKTGKKKNLLTPTTFSILHTTDFADRLANVIVPPLQAGMIVLADRYIYTAFARDVARGVHPAWVRNLYSFAAKPDIAFYFKVPIEVSIARILTGRTKLKFYEAGMDLGLSDNPVTSFKLFQSLVLKEYDQLTEEFGLTVIDGTGPIDKQQEIVRELVRKELMHYEKRRPMGIIPQPQSNMTVS